MTNSPQTTSPPLRLMLPGERIAGLWILPIHVLISPILMLIYVYATEDPRILGFRMEAIQYTISLGLILFFMLPYLRRAFHGLLDRFVSHIWTLLLSYPLYWALWYAVSIFIVVFGGDIILTNFEDISALTRLNFSPLFGLNVILIPVVDEVLFRGVLFGCIRNKNQVLSYIVSVLLYAFSHSWLSLLVSEPSLFPLVLIQYIPLGIIQTWCYERAGSVWVSVIFHMAANASLLISQAA